MPAFTIICPIAGLCFNYIYTGTLHVVSLKYNSFRSVLTIFLSYYLEEKSVVALSVLPHLLDTRGKKSDYSLINIIEVRFSKYCRYLY